jgi:hypothetical protein
MEILTRAFKVEQNLAMRIMGRVSEVMVELMVRELVSAVVVVGERKSIVEKRRRMKGM